MYVGHINLSTTFCGAGENFVGLVESLQQHGVQQYILVRNVQLATRLELVENVTVGPIVRTPVAAYCLMPHVDVVHIHDQPSSAAGILLVLTRAIPFVLTSHETTAVINSRLNHAACKRASGFISEKEASVTQYLQTYQQAVGSLRIPTMQL